MKTLALLAIAMTLAIISPAADSPAVKFPDVGGTYKIATTAALAEIPFDNIVTITALGEHQWVKVEYQVMTRSGKEKHSQWLNLAQVTSAVKAEPAK